MNNNITCYSYECKYNSNTECTKDYITLETIDAGRGCRHDYHASCCEYEEEEVEE